MILTEEHQISKNHTYWEMCDKLCFMSKNLYNASLYYIRSEYRQTGTYKTDKGYLYTLSHLNNALFDSVDYRTECHPDNPNKLNTKCLKQVWRQLQNDYTNYFKAVKSYKRNPKKFNGCPKSPRYKDKKGRNVFTFPIEALSFKTEGYIHLSMTEIYVKTNLKKGQIKEISIVPSTNHYKILIKYDISNVEMQKKHKKYAGIDLGVNNLITLSSNDIDVKPIIINGRPIKSINQYYNKQLAVKKSLLQTKSSNAIKKLTGKRNNKIKNYIHHATRHVVNYLINNGITCLIIGKNDFWKQSINIGTRNNQTFVQIPFNMVINQLKYKCEMVGIEVLITEESYTSKCSFLDNEEIKKHDIYSGSRVKRGLFKSANGKTINADLNGSLNIIRKVAGNGIFPESVEAYAGTPVSVNCDQFNKYKVNVVILPYLQ